jgi:hypothetical protein
MTDAYEATQSDAQSAVEREPVLRLASLLWRLRRAMTTETGLHLRRYRQARQLLPAFFVTSRGNNPAKDTG